MKAGLLPATLAIAVIPFVAPAAQRSTDRVVIALVVIPLTSAVILEGLANGTIDLGHLGATDMINTRKIGVADLLLAGEINGHPSYRSY